MRFTRYLLIAYVGVSLFCSFLSAQQPAASASSAVVPRLVSFSGNRSHFRVLGNTEAITQFALHCSRVLVDS